MKKMMICFCMLTVVQLNAQDPVLKVGSPFPRLLFPILVTHR